MNTINASDELHYRPRDNLYRTSVKSNSRLMQQPTLTLNENEKENVSDRWIFLLYIFLIYLSTDMMFLR